MLHRVRVRPAPDLSARFPHELPCRLTVRLGDGRVFSIEKADYQGFVDHPPDWNATIRKFRFLSEAHTTRSQRDEIIDAIENLEHMRIRDLARLLQRTGAEIKTCEEALQGAI